MTLNERKNEALKNYKEAKKCYFETLDKKDWMKFCECKRICMLLGVRI